MHDVSAEQAFLTAIDEFEHDMARTMPRSRVHGETVREQAVAVDDLGLSGLDHGQDAVGEDAGIEAALSGRAGPVIVLGPGENISGIGEGRYPASVAQLRVPAAMVGVKMRAADEIDLVRCDAGLGEPRQEGQVCW